MPRKILQKGIKISANSATNRTLEARRDFSCRRGLDGVEDFVCQIATDPEGSFAILADLRSRNPGKTPNLVATKALTPFGLRISKHHALYT